MGTQLGTAPDGSPYNQVINGHEYWYQEEWSNQTAQCLQNLAFSGAEPTAAFSSTGAGGTTENFDATGSTAPGGVFAFGWQFNDSPGLSNPLENPGSTPTASDGAFGSSGPYDVGLTVFGSDGTSAGAGQLITPGSGGAIQGFAVNTGTLLSGHPVSFTGLGSLDGSAVTIYNWDFGDGTADLGAVAVAHIRHRAGPTSSG